MLLRKALWCLQPSQFEYKIVQRGGINHQEANQPSDLKTNCEDKNLLGEEIPVIPVPQETFVCALEMKTTNFKRIKEREGQSVTIISHVYMMAGFMHNKDGNTDTSSTYLVTVHRSELLFRDRVRRKTRYSVQRQ